MNQPNRTPVPQPNSTSTQLSPELLQAFLQNQQVEAQNEASRIKLREKELELNAKFSTESLKLNADYLGKQPSENRKMVTLMAVIGILSILIVIGFIVYLIESGHEEFVLTVLKGVGVLILNALSYYFGKSQGSKPSSPSGDVPSAEVVE